MDLLIEKLDGSRYYLSQYKVLITDFEESAPSVTRNSKQLDQRNGNIDFGGWHTDKTINITGYYRADDMDEEETLREKLYALLSEPDGYYITQLKTTPSVAMERPGETSGGYYDKLKDYPSHKRFLVYTEAPEMELVGNVNGTLLYKLTAEFKTIKLPYGESLPHDLDIKPNFPYYGRNLLLDTDFNNLPQYWTAANGTVTGTFNGHNVFYSDATKLTDDFKEVLRQPIYDPALTNNMVLPSHWYTLSFYAKGVGKMSTYVYGSFVDSDSYSYIDDVKLGYANPDGSHDWDLTDDWTRHTYTFKSKSSFPDTDVQNVLWRLFKGNEGYICMQKLEEGTVATPYSPAPEDSGYNEWYFDTYYNTDNLFIPYAGTVPCNQLEQGFAIEMTAKEASSSLSFKIDDTELTSSNAVAAGDVFMFSGFSYTQNGLSIVSKTNTAYFILQPDKPNRITCNVPGTVRIIGLQNLYA